MSQVSNRSRITLAIIASIIVASVWVIPANALSNTGPSPGITSVGNKNSKKGAGKASNPEYVLVKSDNTGDLSTLHLPFYSKTLVTSNVTVTVKDVACSVNFASCSSSDQYIDVYAGSTRLTKPNNIRAGTFTIPKAKFVFDSNTNTYRALITFQLRNGKTSTSSPKNAYRNRIGFRLVAPSAFFIGTGSANSDVNLIDDNPTTARADYFYDYTIDFATPCNVTKGTVKSITLVDLDSGQEQNSYKTVTVKVIDADTGKTVSGSESGSKGNGKKYYYSITFQPGKKYKLLVYNLEAQNQVQYRLPYDAINSNVSCVAPSDFNLNPIISLQQNQAEVGSTVNIDSSIANSGSTDSDGTQWQFSYITIPSGGSTPGATNSDSAPCAYYGGGGRTCSIALLSGGTTNATGTGLVVGADGYSFVARQALVQDVPVGTKICYSLSVKNRSDSSTQWRHSALACAVISKRPLIQIHGSDLIVGRGSLDNSDVATSIKSSGGLLYGSWSEYGVMASGSVTGMGSAAGFAGGTSASTLCGVSFLTFSNRPSETSGCSDSSIGNYTFKSTSQTIASQFPASSAAQIAGNYGIGSFADKGVYTNNSGGSTINITAGSGETIPKGKWFVINAPNATVRIKDNIVYTGDTLTKLSDIPQVVIIAKNITIDDSVTQVDAWLIATGDAADGIVNTCNKSGTLTSLICDKKLTVNGPVVANHLLLRRTAGAGSDAASGDPAEVFNLRPDAYLWANSLQTGTYKAKTVMTTELPPRY